MLRPFRVVRSIWFSLNCCGFTVCWISRRAFLVDAPTQRAKKIKIILKFLLGMSGHMADLPGNMSGKRWKIISRPNLLKKSLTENFIFCSVKPAHWYAIMQKLTHNLKCCSKFLYENDDQAFCSRHFCIFSIAGTLIENGLLM